MARKPTYAMGGHVFTLRPTTPAVRRELLALEDKRNEEYAEKGGSYQTTEEVYADRDQLLFEKFCIVTEGPHEEIDFDTEFDMRAAEEAIEDFLPEHVRMMKRLSGFLL